MNELVADDFRGADLSFTIEKASPIVLRSPIATPVQTSFGIMTDRPAVYLVVEDTQGNTGVGEVWCNFPACGAEHRVRLLNTAILPALLGTSFSSPAQCFDFLQSQFKRLALQTGEFGPLAQSIAGIDIALWDLVATRLNVPLYRLFGGKHCAINVYASGINPTGTLDTLKRCQAAGYNAFKLKIGFGDDIDYPNIERICAQLTPGQMLMVDANQAWTLDEAVLQSRKLADYPIQWLEEPLMADTSDQQWNTLAEASTIPLAAGENMADSALFAQGNKSDWLSVMQPDLCKWGGFSGVLPVAKQAITHGKRYCPHFLGGGVGLAASAHALAAVGGNGLLEIDANPNPLREILYSPDMEDGQIELGSEPGLGISVRQIAELQTQPAYSANRD